MSQFSNVPRFARRDALEVADADHNRRFVLVDRQLTASLPLCHPSRCFVEAREYKPGGKWRATHTGKKS